MKAKSTFPARNAQRSALWRIADAICPSPVLQLMPVCAILGLNRPVIRWMSAKFKPHPTFPMTEIPDYLIQMVRRQPPVSQVVARSTPVVSFGNALTASVATLGINPSVGEFKQKGALLEGPERRLATLDSLGADDTNSLSNEQLNAVLHQCWNYFSGNPYWRWFRPLDDLMRRSVGASYSDGTACHLDLVQWATEPIWGEMRDPAVRHILLNESHKHLVNQLRQGNFKTILLNGISVVNQVRKENLAQLQEVAEVVSCGTVTSRLYEGARENVRFFGWSTNLQRSPGVTREFKSQLAEWIRSRFER